MSTTHPVLLGALCFVEQNLADPKLTVARVAQALDVNPSYLSHLFISRLGRRLGRFIAGQRVERAKTLLATTDLQVKQIAFDTGHANASWFVHLFRTHTGFTPAEYRARSRRRSA